MRLLVNKQERSGRYFSRKKAGMPPAFFVIPLKNFILGTAQVSCLKAL